MQSTESAAYTKMAIVLHWLIALLIVFLLALGWSFDDIPDGNTKIALILLHESVGIAVLLLSFARLGWRLMHKAPPLPATMPRWEKTSADIVHVFLYALMILQPLSGWAMVSANPRNIPIVLFGLVPWPHVPLLVQKKEVAEMFFNAHAVGAALFALLAAGHAAAALQHHFIARDGILLRMFPRSWAGFLNRLRGRASG